MDDVAGTTDGIGVVSSVDTSLTLLTGAASAWERQRGTPPQPQPVAAEEEKVPPPQQNQSQGSMGDELVHSANQALLAAAGYVAQLQINPAPVAARPQENLAIAAAVVASGSSASALRTIQSVHR
ncbi:uncharacterized protein LOC133904157 isoform X3 [Phragmites australis]|uniref:uncharacterized protein LOC133904157 isoform X3 n=1 Tax=Phragmites australis TaxID=29695 RepID=UPI002D771575|nr:uncharacterized protein LOC133904157 isoform X3 [Phragmites australis]